MSNTQSGTATEKEDLSLIKFKASPFCLEPIEQYQDKICDLNLSTLKDSPYEFEAEVSYRGITAQEAASDLNEQYKQFKLEAISNSSDETASDITDMERVDQSVMTDTETEVLKTALEEGYYEEPREINNQELGAILGCSGQSVTNSRRRGIHKLLKQVLED